MTTAALDGFGLGLRPEHYHDFLEKPQRVEWLEILTDNYLVPGGKPLYYLDRIREQYPVVMHGVAMNIGSCDPLDLEYLHSVKKLADRVQPLLLSDHLCWTGVKGSRLHDLLPLPYTDEAVTHVSDRIQKIQDILQRRLTIENVSTYVQARAPLEEWEFVNAIVEKADCELLLDVNNIYVSARNSDFNPQRYIDAIPIHRVRQIHLAGHSDYGDHCIDTHDQPVCDEVWDLYRYTIERSGSIPTMIERDDNINSLSELIAELDIAREISSKASSFYANRTLEHCHEPV
ncbi:MNIO family bufferin maturase [Pseudomaricurvus sp.]|uniref:MNIO family bufferin maturase n=1 Tax=Pseudomaricurvus sp. TaxID=2004510 RepID=UPI003F6A8365